MKTSKLTVTISKESYERIEKEKMRRGLTRSAVVNQMISFYFQKMQDLEKEKKYIAGYKNKPERTEDIAALETIQAEAMGEF
ncbi:MAG: ribbon-helix-helix protein, CopG family [Vulcanimicrobiota bacterium]